MKLEQIEQVIVVAETRSIRLAAENLFISQPNLSLSIRKLEEEIGCPLFARNNKGVELTPLGESFVEYARGIAQQIRQLQTLGASALNRGRLSLSIGNMHYRYVNHAAAQLLRDYGAQQLHLTLREGVRSQVIAMVESRQCDIGLIGMFSHYHKILLKQLETRGIQYFRLCSNPVTVIVGRGSPLFSSPLHEVEVERLWDYPIIIYNESELGPYGSVIDAVGLGGRPRRIVVSERSTLFELLDKTPCFSVTATDEIAYQNTDYYDKIRSIRMKNCQITGEIGWIKRRDMPQTNVVLDFLQILSSYYTVMNGILPL